MRTSGKSRARDSVRSRGAAIACTGNLVAVTACRNFLHVEFGLGNRNENNEYFRDPEDRASVGRIAVMFAADKLLNEIGRIR